MIHTKRNINDIPFFKRNIHKTQFGLIYFKSPFSSASLSIEEHNIVSKLYWNKKFAFLLLTLCQKSSIEFIVDRVRITTHGNNNEINIDNSGLYAIINSNNSRFTSQTSFEMLYCEEEKVWWKCFIHSQLQ